MRRATITLVLFDGVAKLLAAGSTLLLIHILPVAEYAKLTLASAAISLVAQTTASSVNLIYIFASQNSSLHAERGSLLGLQALGALLLCTAFLLPFDLDALVVFAAAALGTAFVTSDFVRTEYQRRLAFRHYAAIELLRSGLFLLLIISILWLAPRHLTAASALGLQAVAIALISAPALIRLDLTRGISNLSRGLTLARGLLTAHYRDLFYYYLALALFSQLGVFMLKQLGTTGSLAAYGAASRYYNFLMVALSAAQAVLLPTVAGARAKDELRRAYRKHGTLILLFVPVVIAACVLTPWFMPWIDGGRYPDAVPIFWILAASAFISFACSPYVFVVMRFGRLRFLLVLVLITAVFNTTLNAVLIPTCGGVGAAVATLLSYAFLNGTTFYRALRLLRDANAELPELSPLTSAALK